MKQTAAHITKLRSMIGQVRLKLRVIAGGTAVAAAVEVQQMSRLVVAGVKEKRIVYTDVQKTTILQKVLGMELHTAFAAVRAVPGFEKVTKKMVIDWQAPKVPNRRGRPYDAEFEKQVLGELIYTAVATCVDSTAVSIVANVAYSYAIIQEAAGIVQKFPHWVPPPEVFC